MNHPVNHLLEGQIDLPAWRKQVRNLLVQNIPPDEVDWIDRFDIQKELDFSRPITLEPVHTARPNSNLRVPGDFLSLARFALCHSNRAKWSLTYRVLWRLTHGERTLLDNPVDDDVLALRSLAKAVKRDAHKMKAFVRFRKVEDDLGTHYVAFHRPVHPIVRLVAPFFAQRFSVMRWTILTRFGSASWDCSQLSFGPPASSAEAPTPDTLEDFWKTYYTSVFNPARANPQAMSKEMPKRYWSTLPEAQLIDDLLRDAPTRVRAMSLVGTGSDARAFIPNVDASDAKIALPQLAQAACACRGCDLHERATQTVFGHGPADAKIMLVGEQPGDQEDLTGKPFVGPAGQLLSDALERAGLDRDACYLTNAVKHFKWVAEPRGKRRIHQRASPREIRACRPWLEKEISMIKPTALILLGATAAQSLLGNDFRVLKRRGEILTATSLAPIVMATIHPSAILRTPEPSMREMHFNLLVKELLKVNQLVD